MGLINNASANSFWRGIDYQQNGKVKSFISISESVYTGMVFGSGDNVYHVTIDIEHIRNSKCDCPFAKDTRIICKHMVALYFEIFPEELVIFLEEAEKAEEEYEKYQDELREAVHKHIKSMTKKDLQNALLFVLESAPEWVYDRFVRDYTDFWL